MKLTVSPCNVLATVLSFEGPTYLNSLGNESVQLSVAEYECKNLQLVLVDLSRTC